VSEKLESYVTTIFNSSKQELYEFNFFHKLKLYKSKLTYEYSEHVKTDNIIVKKLYESLITACTHTLFSQMTMYPRLGALTIIPLIKMNE
jgi:hypothetical protein